MIKTVYDFFWPNNGITNTAYRALALLEREDGFFAFYKVKRTDIEGEGDYIELIGMDIPGKEDSDVAIKKHINALFGGKSEVIAPITVVKNYFNLTKTELFSYFYYMKATSNNIVTELTVEEEGIMKEVIWLSLEEALEILTNEQTSNFGKLIYRRDIVAVQRLFEIKK